MPRGWSKGCECCIFARVENDVEFCEACQNDLNNVQRKFVRTIKEEFNPIWLSENTDLLQKMFFDANVIAALKRGNNISPKSDLVELGG